MTINANGMNQSSLEWYVFVTEMYRKNRVCYNVTAESSFIIHELQRPPMLNVEKLSGAYLGAKLSQFNLKKVL
jgi:hypothetical protein